MEQKVLYNSSDWLRSLKMKKNLKSMLGLNTVKAFIIVLLSLAIIGVVTLVVLASIANIQTVGMRTVPVANVSTGYVMNSTTPYVVDTTSNCLLTVSGINNGTGGDMVLGGNYSVSGCTVTALATAGDGYNNTVWFITGTFSDTAPLDTINENVSAGITSFFTNSTTYFALLGVVVIILIISLVVVVVNRFGGETMGSREVNPSL